MITDAPLRALIEASRSGDIGAVRAALEQGADVDGILDYEFPLLVAVSSGKAELVEYLISCGADLERVNELGDTPLCAAAIDANEEIIRALLAGSRGKNSDLRARVVADLRAHRLELDARKIEERLADAICLVPEAGECKVGATKFGGGPDLPEGDAWPIDGGKPIPFLLQVRCEELHEKDPHGLLPEDGLLSFFCRVVPATNGYEVKPSESHRVLYTPSRPGLRLARLPLPEGFSADRGESSRPNMTAFPERTLRPESGLSLLPDLSARDMRKRQASSGDQWASWYHTSATGRPPITMMGVPRRPDIRVLPDLPDPVVLLQMVTDWDLRTQFAGGREHFIISRADLAARRFDRVRVR